MTENPAKKAPKNAGAAHARATRERILTAAEHLFAEHGYDGTSIRDIAAAAETRVGLVSYHFQTKEALYETIIEQKSAEIGRRRLNALAKERREAGIHPIGVERIIFAYTHPFLELAHLAGPEWKSYTRIISNVANSQRWTSLISTYYDPVASVFLTELRRAMPNCSEVDIVACFTFSVSVMLGIAAETGRTDNLSNGALPSTDIEQISRTMLPFLAAGFSALERRGRGHREDERHGN